MAFQVSFFPRFASQARYLILALFFLAQVSEGGGGRVLSAPSSLLPSPPKKRRTLREIDIERNQHDESNKLSFQTRNIPVECNNVEVVAAVLLSKVFSWRQV